MAQTIVMRGAQAITDPRLGQAGVVPDVAVAIVNGTVAETGPFVAIAAKYPGARVIGDGTQLLMPGLVDAHSHGRGLSPIQKGVHNDFLENALFDWAYMPILPPELTASLCALRHLRSGCTLLHHNGFDDDGPEGARRAHAAIKTYLFRARRIVTQQIRQKCVPPCERSSGHDRSRFQGKRDSEPRGTRTCHSRPQAFREQATAYRRKEGVKSAPSRRSS